MSDTASTSTVEIKIGDTNSSVKHNSVINIDARQFRFKHILILVVLLVIPTLTTFMCQQSAMGIAVVVSVLSNYI